MRIIRIAALVSVTALTVLSPQPTAEAQLRGAEAEAAITCHRYFQRHLNKFNASFHKIEVQRVNGIYRLHWLPANFKVKNRSGQWVKTHAFCELGRSSNGEYQDLKLLKVAGVTLVDNY